MFHFQQKKFQEALLWYYELDEKKRTIMELSWLIFYLKHLIIRI